MVRMKAEELDDDLLSALVDALPEGANMGFNYEGPEAWLHVTTPLDTEEVLDQAKRALGR